MISGIVEGRCIHYIAYNGRHLAGLIIGHSQSLPNGIARLDAAKGEIDLVLFTDMDNINGVPNAGVQFQFNVPYSEGLEPGTWHWIERV